MPGRSATARTATKRSRRSDAYEQLLMAIVFGDLAPGSSVDEKRIADRFGLGLAVVRNALNRLALEGMVERHPRIGTRIPELSLSAMHSVFEARVVMEGTAAALAAERASPQNIAALRGAFAGVEDAIEQRDHRRVVAMDQAFHTHLAASTNNDSIERIIRQLHSNALRFWYFGLTRLDASVILEDIRTHLAVVDAIEARDPKAAAAAMRAVIGVFPDSVKFFMTGSDALQQVFRSDDIMPTADIAPDRQKAQA